MNADAEFYARVLRYGAVPRCYVALDLDHASCCIDGTSALHQHAVACGLDDTATMRGAGSTTAFLTLFSRASVPSSSAPIRRQHRRQSPLHPFAGQRLPLDRQFQPTHQSMAGRC
jgi:hypothetical protein